MKQIAAVILAAGNSRRFGANKLLATASRDDHEMPILAYSLRPWLAMFERVIVVIKAGDDEVKSSMKHVLEQYAHIDWVECREADQGMGVSLACGIQHASQADGWIIGLGDMPLISSDTISAIKDGLSGDSDIVAPYYKGKRGHPIGFGVTYKSQLLALDQDAGAKHLLENNALSIKRIDVDDAGILTDIDTPTDLDELRLTLHSTSKN